MTKAKTIAGGRSIPLPRLALVWSLISVSQFRSLKPFASWIPLLLEREQQQLQEEVEMQILSEEEPTALQLSWNVAFQHSLPVPFFSKASFWFVVACVWALFRETPVEMTREISWAAGCPGGRRQVDSQSWKTPPDRTERTHSRTKGKSCQENSSPPVRAANTGIQHWQARVEDPQQKNTRHFVVPHFVEPQSLDANPYPLTRLHCVLIAAPGPKFLTEQRWDR
mmetsp:Transcript_1653/g.4736  ORF Transcript_1653/g.4736 Transcript_1653/m.4736 type:complete len:224 (+) Transcript_1653:275-946(+)